MRLSTDLRVTRNAGHPRLKAGVMTDDRITLPSAPAPQPPWRFPLVAVLAPVVVSVVIWLVTGSPFALLFAALGPVTALASVADQWWSARRSRRRDLARVRQEAAAVTAEIVRAHEHERAALNESTPDGVSIVDRRTTDRGRWQRSGDDLVIVVGRGRIPSVLTCDGSPGNNGEAADVLRGLADLARWLPDGPIRVDPGLGIGVCGPPPAALACARGLVVQVARALAPEQHWVAPSIVAGAAWVHALPHRVREVECDDAVVEFGAVGSDEPLATICWATTEAELPSGCQVVLEVATDGPGRIAQHPDRALRRELEPTFVSEIQALGWAERVAADARAAGRGATAVTVPAAVGLSSIMRRPDPIDTTLACELGVSAVGPVTVDLVADGPHAVVGGTTGSGKSELLVAWVVAMAAAHPPERVCFLLVDYKGGSAFEPLRALPHTVGIITDLDAAETERALQSLRAELRYRERELAREGARAIDGSTLPRLVIVVDEFAAMLVEHPDLHAVFSDIAARGRSLGVHLVLCTQRPAGVVRDSVLANSDLRVSLRVNNRGDSRAVVDADTAAELPVSARGRAVLKSAAGEPVVFQVALAENHDIEAAAARWDGSLPQRRPWCDPLPERVERSAVTRPADGIVLGLVDLPHEQRQATATYDQRADGHLLVLGGPRSGKSTTLAVVGGEQLPPDPAAAWDGLARCVEMLDAQVPGEPTLVSIDDVDALVARFGAEHRAAWLDSLERVLREGPSRGIHVVLSAQRLAGDLYPIAALAPARLMLRHTTRQDWVLAGGESTHALEEGNPGAARWRGHRMQVLFVEPEVVEIKPLAWDTWPADRPIVVATTRAAALASRLAHAGRLVRGIEALGTSPGDLSGVVVVGDVEEWQSRWGLLTSLRATSEVLFDACAIADFRSLTRSRVIPPPLPPGPDVCWRLRSDGSVGRALLV